MLDDPPLSWRVEHGDSDALQMALFVRDAAGLDVPGVVGIPTLTGVSARDVAVDLTAAGRQWPSWWQQVLELHVTDPPGFVSLGDRPDLQAAARAVVDGHQAWSRSLPQRQTELDWALLKQTAEDVAFDHRVSIDRVQARIVVLPVDGVWWTRVAPGSVLSSVAAAEDPVVAQTMVRDAFVSGLTR